MLPLITFLHSNTSLKELFNFPFAVIPGNTNSSFVHYYWDGSFKGCRCNVLRVYFSLLLGQSSAATMFCFNNVRLQRSGWFLDCCMKGYIQHLYRGLNQGYVSASMNNVQFKIFGKDRNEQSNKESSESRPVHFPL